MLKLVKKISGEFFSRKGNVMFKKIPLLAALVVVVLVSLLVFSGCSKAAEEASEKAAEEAVKKETGKDVDIEYDQDKVKIETEEGKAEIEKTAEIPKEFPSDYPIYPGAKLDSVVKIEEQGQKAYQLVFKSGDSVTEIFAYYKKAFPEKGYKISFSMEAAEQSIFAISKGGDDVGSLTITPEKEGSLITVLYIEK